MQRRGNREKQVQRRSRKRVKKRRKEKKKGVQNRMQNRRQGSIEGNVIEVVKRIQRGIIMEIREEEVIGYMILNIKNLNIREVIVRRANRIVSNIQGEIILIKRNCMRKSVEDIEGQRIGESIGVMEDVERISLRVK